MKIQQVEKSLQAMFPGEHKVINYKKVYHYYTLSNLPMWEVFLDGIAGSLALSLKSAALLIATGECEEYKPK